MHIHQNVILHALEHRRKKANTLRPNRWGLSTYFHTTLTGPGGGEQAIWATAPLLGEMNGLSEGQMGGVKTRVGLSGCGIDFLSPGLW